MPFHRQDSFRDHYGVSPDASDMSTHLQKSLSPAAVRLFYLIRADFMVVVVMVMFTGIFGKNNDRDGL
uniref:hypothetical protein n=1 Tax=Klebsiella grimontii TaxID=2058152 RepID=UPI00236411D1|nr:hypothetical protein [Klebsiella grimontii]